MENIKIRNILIFIIVLLITIPAVYYLDYKNKDNKLSEVIKNREIKSMNLKNKKYIPKNLIGSISIENKIYVDLLSDKYHKTDDKKNKGYYNSLNYGAVMHGNEGQLGQVGNVVITAHDYPYFANLKNVSIGDTIKVVAKRKTYKYKVFQFKKVEQTEGSSVFFETDKKTLTIFTCKAKNKWDKYSPTQRIVYYAVYVE